jgi:hypothetical protein
MPYNLLQTLKTRPSRLPRPITFNGPYPPPTALRGCGLVIEKVFLSASQMTPSYAYTTRSQLQQILTSGPSITPSLYSYIKAILSTCSEIESESNNCIKKGPKSNDAYERLERAESALRRVLGLCEDMRLCMERRYVVEYGAYMHGSSPPSDPRLSSTSQHHSQDRNTSNAQKQRHRFGLRAWKDVQTLMREEKLALALWQVRWGGGDERKPKTPMLDQLEEVGKVMGVCSYVIHWNVNSYGSWSLKPASVVREMVLRKLWRELAMRICTDMMHLKDSVEEELYAVFRDAIDRCEEMWFVDPRETTRIGELETGEEYIESCMPRAEVLGESY